MENVHISKIQSVIFVEPLSDNIKRGVFGNNLYFYELVFKISGESIISFNNKKIHLTPNSVMILPKSNNVEYYVDYIKQGECIDVFFDTENLLPKEAYKIDTSNNIKLNNLFVKIHKIWTSRQQGYYNKCMSLLYEIFSEIEKTKYTPSSKVKRLKLGIEYLNTNALSQDIDYLKPAKLCNVCPTYFRRAFKEIYGISPFEYVKKIRIDYAKELLLLNQYSVSDISNLCGYSDVYQFSKQFKNTVGVSPKNYRQFS
ncbi:MAG: helix-turn-helix transcriptional regulator [Acutalibacteraceae bacterium]|nr:helix-turn-helix transcriptional regulator [Acutalibacteraceae bacterium]